MTVTAKYDCATNTMNAGDSGQGIKTACSFVDNVAQTGMMLTLVKGIYQPWWGETVNYKLRTYSDICAPHAMATMRTIQLPTLTPN